MPVAIICGKYNNKKRPNEAWNRMKTWLYKSLWYRNCELSNHFLAQLSIVKHFLDLSCGSLPAALGVTGDKVSTAASLWFPVAWPLILWGGCLIGLC